MNCLYCDQEIKTHTLSSIFFEDDLLCENCRKQLNRRIRHFNNDGLKITYFYDYNSLFKSILLQYKECYDEALKDVFLFNLKEYLYLLYHDYYLCYVPSSKDKLAKRGFNHLQLIFKDLGLKELTGLKMIEERSQEGLDLKNRQLMLNNYVYEGFAGNKVLIVDDVYTTGSSIMGVFYALQPHFSQIRAIIMAKV